MECETIINLVLTLLIASSAILALFQTNIQIKLSNKQFLFEKRIDRFLLTKSLLNLYEANYKILDHSNYPDEDPLIIDFKFRWLVNITYLKDMAFIIDDLNNVNYKNIFLTKIEDLKRTSEEIKFIFANENGMKLSTYIMNYQNLLMKMFEYQLVVDLMNRDATPRNKNFTYNTLQKNYGELTYRYELYKAIDQLKNSYDDIVKNDTVHEIEKMIEL